MSFVISQFSDVLKSILATKSQELVDAISDDKRKVIEVDGLFFDVGPLTAPISEVEGDDFDPDTVKIISVD